MILPFTQHHLASTETPEFRFLLKTNKPPSQHDAIVIRAELAAAARDLVAIDAELPQLEAALKAIRARRGTLAVFTKRYQPVISPVRRLPAELLARIFLLCRSDQKTDILNVAGYPWNLTMVCSYWRAVAISTPRLWNTIAMHPIPKTAVRSKILIDLFIKRSMNTRLFVTITRECMIPRFHHNLAALISTSHRWSELTLSTDFTELMPRCLFALRNRLPVLQSLTIISNGYVEALYSSEAVDIFWTAPELNSVTIRNASSTLFRLPWQQITNFDYQNITSDSTIDDGPGVFIFDVLKNVPRLVNLRYGSASFLPDDDGNVVLPHLRHLDITFDSTFLEVMTLPALESLSIHLLEDDGFIFDLGIIKTMLSHSHPPLTSLAIRKFEALDARGVIELLMETPDLIHLTLDSLDDMDDEFFQALTLNPARQPLIPNLESIYIVVWDDTLESAVDAMLDFLESRCAPGTSLKLKEATVRVPERLLAMPSRAYRLKCLTDAGLKFQTSY